MPDFALIVVEGPEVDPGMVGPIRLESGHTVIFRIDPVLPPHWVESLGTIQAEHVRKSSLAILYASTAPSPSNRNLFECARRLFYGILLHGLPAFHGGLLLGGYGNLGEADGLPPGPSINSVSPFFLHRRTDGQYTSRITEQVLRAAARVAEGFREIYCRPTEYQRLKRGIDAWIKGVLAGSPSERLHEFVRALDAVVFLKKKEGESQFVDRCQTFVGRSVVNARRFGEMYRLRNAEEHLGDVLSVVADFEPDQKTMVRLRAYQAGEVASFVIRTLLTEPRLRSKFVEDKTIEGLWQGSSSDWLARWGADTLDLRRKSEEGFFLHDLSEDTMAKEGLNAALGGLGNWGRLDPASGSSGP